MEIKPGYQTTENIASMIVPGHYIDAHMATEKSLLNSPKEKIRVYAKEFKPINLSSNEHRAMTALWGLYHEAGYNEEVFKTGVIVTPYDLCKRMGYSKDKKGRFGGKARRSALNALINLSRKSFDIYVTKYTGRENGKKIFDVVVLPNKSLIDIQYAASNVTEEDLINGAVKGKVKAVTAQEALAGKEDKQIIEGIVSGAIVLDVIAPADIDKDWRKSQDQYIKLRTSV